MTEVRHYLVKQQDVGVAHAVPIASVYKDPISSIDAAWTQCMELNKLVGSPGKPGTFFWVLTTSTSLTVGDAVRPLENEEGVH